MPLAQRFHFDSNGFKPAVEIPCIGTAALRHSQCPGDLLRLLQGVGKLGKPLGATGSIRSIHCPSQAYPSANALCASKLPTD